MTHGTHKQTLEERRKGEQVLLHCYMLFSSYWLPFLTSCPVPERVCRVCPEAGGATLPSPGDAGALCRSER
jgi:hypothetical protein